MTAYSSRALVSVERSLFAIGAVLAVWCAFTIIEARYYNALPIPDRSNGSARRLLPGESPGPENSDTRSRSPLRPGTWIARLEAPSVGLSATVIEGSDDRTLSRAAGHIEETALPGQRGNVAIAAHRDTVFRPLRLVRAGDALALTTADRIYRYRVTSTQIVKAEDVHVLDPKGHPTLTLVTCYPFTFIGRAPLRFVVFADLVEENSRAGSEVK
jgi:sortase A